MKHAVILAGGSGTRFWPLSRKMHPKQFLHFEDERSLLQATWDRLDGVVPEKTRWIVGGQAHRHLILQDLPEIDATQLLIEPIARNTAPAIALAALHVMAKDKDAVMVVLPADHFVANNEAFHRALECAFEVTTYGGIVTLGVKPSRADTGFGYIEYDPLFGDRDFYPVSRFVEKPDANTAERYVKEQRYLWNSGIFIFRASAMYAFMQQIAKDIAEPLLEYQAKMNEPSRQSVLERIFTGLPNISIDYAVIEKAPLVHVVPLDCGWSDVGSFDALPEICGKDQSENTKLDKTALLLDAKRNVVVNPSNRKVCMIGVNDLIVVQTTDALLIMPREQSQRVREVVAALKENQPELL